MTKLNYDKINKETHKKKFDDKVTEKQIKLMKEMGIYDSTYTKTIAARKITMYILSKTIVKKNVIADRAFYTEDRTVNKIKRPKYSFDEEWD